MLKRTGVIIILALTALAAWLYYRSTITPSGITEMGSEEGVAAQITALVTAIASAGGAIAGLGMKYIDYRKQSLELKVKEQELALKELEIEAKRREMDAG